MTTVICDMIVNTDPKESSDYGQGETVNLAISAL